jgi:hypothetical protein
MKLRFSMVAGAFGKGNASGMMGRLLASGFLDDPENLPLMVMPVDAREGVHTLKDAGYLDAFRGIPYEVFVEEPKRDDIWGCDESQRYAYAYKRCLETIDEFEADAIVVMEDVACFSENWMAWLRMSIEQIAFKHKGHWALTLSMFTPEPDKAFRFGFQWLQLNVSKGHANQVGPVMAFGAKAARSFSKTIDISSSQKFSRMRDDWILDERIPYYSTAPSIARYTDELQADENVGYKYNVCGFRDRLPKLGVR